MTQLLALGLNHTTAGIDLRERVAFPAEKTRHAVIELRRRLAPVVQESAILSTCNRTELYCAARDRQAAQGALVGWLAEAGAVAAEELRPHIYTLPQRDAVRHVFRLASGLDSMVLGEPQILGQIKQAVRHAEASGALGSHLQQLFQRSFSVAKEVRSRTAIGSASVSLASAAVRLAQRRFADLGEARVLFIGAGEMIELAATHFAAQHPREMVVANRTPERAQGLAVRLGARTMALAMLPDRLGRFDVVVSCTASSLPIIGLGMAERAARARAGRPMVLIDLAVPRDIEPEAGRLAGVTLFGIDDLGRLVQSGLDTRRAAVAQAEAIIETRVESFMHWLAAQDTVPLLRMLDERAAQLSAAELARARRLLARGEPVDTVLAALATGLANKFLHTPRTLLARGTLAEDEARRLAELWLSQPGPRTHPKASRRASRSAARPRDARHDNHPAQEGASS